MVVFCAIGFFSEVRKQLRAKAPALGPVLTKAIATAITRVDAGSSVADGYFYGVELDAALDNEEITMRVRTVLIHDADLPRYVFERGNRGGMSEWLHRALADRW